MIEVVTLNGTKPNEKILLHSVNMNPSETRWPFQMQRHQLPVIVSFAMTINKSQGQSLKQVDLYLPKPVFTHGQLYVALSRVKSVDSLKILIPSTDHTLSRTTLNIVYPEIFSACLHTFPKAILALKPRFHTKASKHSIFLDKLF